MATKAKQPLTTAERQARYRERHLENVDSDKERCQFVFAIGTKKRLERIARHYGVSATALLERWAKQETSDIAEKAERKARTAIISRYARNGRARAGK